MSSAAVFLDRDGVLVEPVVAGATERPPWNMSELRLVAGAAGSLERLRGADFLLVAVTNQPDVGRGLVGADAVQRINDVVVERLGLTAVHTCPHDGADGCDCRKPLPGMIVRAAADLDLELSRSWLVGDRWVDIAAGNAAGVRSILVDRPGSWDPTSAGPPPTSLRPYALVSGIREAVDVIMRNHLR